MLPEDEDHERERMAKHFEQTDIEATSSRTTRDEMLTDELSRAIGLIGEQKLGAAMLAIARGGSAQNAFESLHSTE